MHLLIVMGKMSSSNLFGMLYYCVFNILMNNFLQGEYIILDDSFIGTSCNSPYTYVAAFGTLLADLTDPVVVVEKTKLRMPAIYGNGSCVFYYIYNIQYPPSLPNSIQVFVFFVTSSYHQPYTYMFFCSFGLPF